MSLARGARPAVSAAFALEKRRQAGASLDYVLFESGARLGGVLVSERVDDCLVEAGPDSFLTEKPWASDLCREVGLGDQLIGTLLRGYDLRVGYGLRCDRRRWAVRLDLGQPASADDNA